MSKEMQIFNYDGMNIETIMWENHKGKVVPYFKAETIATILGFENPTKAYTHAKHKVNVSYLDVEKSKQSDSSILEESGEINNLPTPYQSLVEKGLSHNEIISKKTWVNEFDIYQMVIKSDKPSAEKFQDWVCEDVLPALRKDGMYIVGEEKVESGEMSEDELIMKAYSLLQSKVDRLQEEKKQLQKHNEQIVDQFVTERITAVQFCKQLNGVNVNSVQNWLAEKGILFKQGNNWKVYSAYRDDYFTERASQKSCGLKTIDITSCYLTKRGAKWLYKHYLKQNLPMKKNWNGKMSPDPFTEDFYNKLAEDKLSSK